MKELDTYKKKYESLGDEIQTTCDYVKAFTDATSKKLADTMNRTSDELIKITDQINLLETKSVDQKFDIDKLNARTTQMNDQIRKAQMDISQLF